MARTIYNGYEIVQTIVGQKRIHSLHNNPDTALRAYRKVVNNPRLNPGNCVVTIYWYLGGKRHELTPTQLFLKSSYSGHEATQATTQGE